MLLSPGLYIVATPIGNLKDISIRALECLGAVSYIACEDTRNTAALLNHYEIKKPLFAIHQHNERSSIQSVIRKIKEGFSVALVSDAGTPLVHDPGQAIVKACFKENIYVSSIPGACAIITALTLSGITAENFFFAGFLPSKGSVRRKKLIEVLNISQPIIFYEAPHRIKELLTQLKMLDNFSRNIILLRELTKKWESRYSGNVQELLDKIEKNILPCRGEFVVILSNKEEDVEESEYEVFKKYKSLIDLVLQHKIPIAKATEVLSNHIKLPKKRIYAFLLEIVKKETFET